MLKHFQNQSSGINICPFISTSHTSGVSGPCSWDPGRLGANGLRLFSEARRCELVFVSWEARWAAVLDRIWPGNMVARWGWECAGPWLELAPGAREKRREFRVSCIWPGTMEARRIVSSGSPKRRSSSVTVNEGPRLGYRGRTIKFDSSFIQTMQLKLSFTSSPLTPMGSCSLGEAGRLCFVAAIQQFSSNLQQHVRVHSPLRYRMYWRLHNTHTHKISYFTYLSRHYYLK